MTTQLNKELNFKRNRGIYCIQMTQTTQNKDGKEKTSYHAGPSFHQNFHESVSCIKLN
jgi:hypothetical protein